MKYILYLLILGVLATGVTSCDSDSTSGGSGNTTKELEVTPSKTSVGIYERFTIKARMTNTPLSDVYIIVDYGNGSVDNNKYPGGREMGFSYDKTGTYSVKVTAFDAYTNAEIASKTISIIVSDVIPSVTLSRESIDTTLMTNSQGELGYITFSFKANAPIGKVRYQTGQGPAFIDSVYPQTTMSLSYEAAGTYKVIVDVYNDKGDYWASDSMTVTIRLPEVTLDMLTSAYNVSVALAVDSTSPIYSLVKIFKTIEAAIQNSGDSIKRIEWSGHSFNAYQLMGKNVDCRFTGSLSTDLQRLETMSVAGYDSTHPAEASKWGYTLSNLELMGVNDQVVIYRAAYKPLSSFVNNEYIQGEYLSSYVHRIGWISNMLNQCTRLGAPLPYAYVIFTRK